MFKNQNQYYKEVQFFASIISYSMQIGPSSGELVSRIFENSKLELLSTAYRKISCKPFVCTWADDG